MNDTNNSVDTSATEVASTATAKPKKDLGYKKLAQFLLPDGTIVNTQKEASEFARRHLVDEALLKVAGGDKNMADWLKSNKDAIIEAFDAATVKRVITQETRDKMRDALIARRAAGLI